MMNLGELIAALEAEDPCRVVPDGFHNPHSWRGEYMELAFEPARNVTVGEMLADARSALGATYQGWKGGDYTMTEYSDCYLSMEGEASGDTFGPLLLRLMLAAGHIPEPATPLAPKDAQTGEQIRWLRRRVEALERLLVCYRIGRVPSEKLMGELELTRRHTGPEPTDD